MKVNKMPNAPVPLPYPGGKHKLAWMLMPYLQDAWRIAGRPRQYREPFVGAGGMLLPFLQWRLSQGGRKPSLWINDKEPGIACFWTALKSQPAKLIRLVSVAPSPSSALFERLKEQMRRSKVGPDGAPDQVLHVAFWEVLLRNWSYSGKGWRGGYSKKVAEAWSPFETARRLRSIARLLEQVDFQHGICTTLDFADVISAPGRALIYCDPTYVRAGKKLYGHFLRPKDHLRLAEVLTRNRQPWVLSYDDAPLVRRLYGDERFRIGRQDTRSDMAWCDGRGCKPTRPELVIVPEEWVDKKWR